MAVAALRALARRLGRIPRRRDIHSWTSGCPWFHTVKRLFGGMQAYQRAAGFRATRKGKPRRRKCVSGRHRMTRANTDISYRPCKISLKPITVRRCRACRELNRAKRPTTKSGREERHRAREQQRQERAAQAQARALAAYRHWAQPGTTAFLRFA